MKKVDDLIAMYSQMDQKELQLEIDAMFEIIWAMLETQECDSISSYPNPNIELKMSCTVIKDEGKYYC